MESREVQMKEDLPYTATFLPGSLLCSLSVLCVPDEKCNRNE